MINHREEFELAVDSPGVVLKLVSNIDTAPDRTPFVNLCLHLSSASHATVLAHFVVSVLFYWGTLEKWCYSQWSLLAYNIVYGDIILGISFPPESRSLNYLVSSSDISSGCKNIIYRFLIVKVRALTLHVIINSSKIRLLWSLDAMQMLF